MAATERSHIVEEITRQYPCRKSILRKLYQYYGTGDLLPAALYLYGHAATGKSSLLEALLSRLSGIKHVTLNTIAAYTNKLFFETIAFELQGISLSSHNGYSYERKIEYMKDFLDELRQLDRSLAYVIVLENAERLRDMDYNLLPMLLQLPEATGQNISVVLLSSLPFEKYYVKTGFPPIVKLFVPEYSRNDMQQILVNDFEKIKLDTQERLQLSEANEEQLLRLERTLTKEFYESYVNIFLSTFWKVCRDISELRLVAVQCFTRYYAPVLEGSIEAHDAMKLWRNIVKVMKSALSTLYMRLGTNNLDPVDGVDQLRLAQRLELPYYAKYLLIAAYLASHNAAKEDKRLFVKNHGKQRKRMQTVNARAKVSEKMATQLGPKPFTVDRLLAIFYSILEGQQVGLTCNLLAQIATLVHLKLLAYASASEGSILEGSARLQCTVGLDFILHIGRMVGFNVRQYLCDFL
ncbi:origin recognition complex subunit 5 [Anopheles cruzii]|uniref:origin recognition complex subunit 5 n=1 Tax=Anopheles cruzii TaxID=68878 RepID=UPI0022EC7EC4|nr:origin recognition complex subunit 5 [Anopheles cruzii]